MSTQQTAVSAGRTEIRGPVQGRHAEVLTREACGFLAELAATFEPRRQELLARRKVRQQQLDAGAMPDFLPETASIREKEWTVAPIPKDLTDRRVEITGPVDRKMIINALNSGASVFMADFEDANSPTWTNNLDGHVNLGDAIRRTISFESPEGKSYKLNDKIATLLVRPRGWHLNEKHFFVDGAQISGSLFDFGLYFFHNAKALMAQWHRSLFLFAQDGKPSGSAPVERRFQFFPGRAGRSARNHSRHGFDRDHPGFV